MDLFVAPTIGFDLLYAFIIVRLARRDLVWINVTAQRECVDHVVLLGEAHLRRILTKYAAYYNESRTHRSLGKDAPIHRAIQHVGRIASVPVLGGLHHHYCRI